MLNFDAKKALEKAKIHLMNKPNTIFYSTILFSLKQEWTDTLPTAAVDGTSLFINPEWFLDLSEEERVGLLAHEAGHIGSDHITRKGNRDHRLYNMAGDYMINNSLVKAKYTLPAGALHSLKFDDSMSTEQVYQILFDEAPKKPDGSLEEGEGTLPGPGSDIIFPSNKIDTSKIQQEIATIVLRAAVQAKEMDQDPGSIPSNALIHLDSVINPKLPWHVVLENYLTRFAKDDYSWSKPNRRYFPDFYLPTAHSEAVCNLAIAVDASGSALDSFSYYIHEIASLKEMMKPDVITLITFDTEIKAVQEITDNTDLMKDVIFTGGGGTDINLVMAWARDNSPDVLIVFTDGEFHHPNKKAYPECPVVWIIDNDPDFTILYGEIIHYDL